MSGFVYLLCSLLINVKYLNYWFIILFLRKRVDTGEAEGKNRKPYKIHWVAQVICRLVYTRTARLGYQPLIGSPHSSLLGVTETGHEGAAESEHKL